MTKTAYRLVAAVALVVSVSALSACGSGGSSSNASGTTTSTAKVDASASKAKADAAIAPYVGHPSAFPVTTPLAKHPTSSTTLAYMDCGTPICALFRDLAKPAAKAIGAKMTVVKTGQSADQINAAFNTVASQKPGALMVTALDPTIWQQPLKKIKADKIPVVTTGIINGADFGLTTPPNTAVFGLDVSKLNGKLVADWVYSKYGDKANVQFNYVPELNFSAVIKDAFESELKSLCPSCEVHELKVPITTLGNKAPQAIVSDLQSHPDTTVVVGSNSENMIGLPAAMKAAGLQPAKEGQAVSAGKVLATVGQAGSPTTLEYLKNGQQTVDLSLDAPVLSWTLVDAATRGATGQPLDPQEAKGLPPQQFLSQSDITFNPAKGWTGYPDFAQRFLKLWKPSA